jgi:hypothetical protein
MTTGSSKLNANNSVNGGLSSSYKSPMNNPPMKALASSSSEFSNQGNHGNQVNQGIANNFKPNTNPLTKRPSQIIHPAAGKSLHSAEAIQSLMNQEAASLASNNTVGYNNGQQQQQRANLTPPKSALKNSSQSTTSSISTAVSNNPSKRGTLKPPPYLTQAPQQQVKFKTSDDIMIKSPSSANGKLENSRPGEGMSKSFHNFSSLQKAFSFHGETAASAANITMDSPYQSPQRKSAVTHSGGTSPLRITSNNTITSRSGGSSNGNNKIPFGNDSKVSSATLSREYPILKPRISVDNSSSQQQQQIDSYNTPQSIESSPAVQSEWKQSRRKFGVQSVDLETPASIVFHNVDSNSSYKFLSANKKLQRNIDDFDSPNIFAENDQDHDDASYNNNSVLTPTTMQSSNSFRMAQQQHQQQPQQQQPQQQQQQQQQQQRQQQQAPAARPSQNKPPLFTPSPAASSSPLQTPSSPNNLQFQTPMTQPRPSVLSQSFTNNNNNNNNHNSSNNNLMKSKYKEQLKINLLIGNITKTIQILNETNTRLSDYFTQTETNDLLWQLVKTENINDIPLLNQSILFLFDEKMISDINCQNMKHESLLQVVVTQDNEYLGRELIRRGADILLLDNDGLCPLSIALSYHMDWLLDEFVNSGREIQLLTKGSFEIKFQYFSFFIITGHSEKAHEMIENEYLRITSEEATDLLNSCRGNFENMKNPIETFELLESLGATVFDG